MYFHLEVDENVYFINLLYIFTCVHHKNHKIIKSTINFPSICKYDIRTSSVPMLESLTFSSSWLYILHDNRSRERSRNLAYLLEQLPQFLLTQRQRPR